MAAIFNDTLPLSTLSLKGDAESDRGNASAIEIEINNHVHILPPILRR